MMKTKQITTESGIVLLLVSVPRDADYFDQYNGKLYCYEQDGEIFNREGEPIQLPEGNWKGKHFKEMSEEECAEFVKWGMDYHDDFGYYNYEQDSSSLYKYPFKTALESMISRINSNGFDPENTVVLTLKKIEI